ncbi:MAG: hypothetical protein E6Q36_08215 [Chryseobacterium sp.]|nr:MAG: hypothetical protein E6Q36_08215 [Chryseobacterium sp.]
MSEVKTSSTETFLGGSAADILQRLQNSVTPQPVVNEPVVEAKVPVQEVPKQNFESGKTAAELLKEKQEQVVEEVTPKEGEDIVETEEAPTGKGGRPSNKLPDDFSNIIAQLEERNVLKGFDDGEYKTIDDFVALLEANSETKIEGYQKEAEQRIFNSMSPAMKAIFDYAQMGVQRPEQLLPLITAADNLNYSTSLDANNPEHHQAIVRNGLAIQGLSAEDIEAEIKDLMESDGKLEKRAAALKPVLDKYNTKQVEDLYRAQQQEQQKERAFWESHRKEVSKQILESPTVSDLKLKRDHRETAAYFLNPDPAMGGLPIYALIDDLIEKKQFGLLTEIVLLGLNKKDYQSYTTTAAVQKSNEQLVRKLKDSATSSTSETNSQPVKPTDKLSRPTKLRMNNFRS